jgi:hypothetical protein
MGTPRNTAPLNVARELSAPVRLFGGGDRGVGG